MSFFIFSENKNIERGCKTIHAHIKHQAIIKLR